MKFAFPLAVASLGVAAVFSLAKPPQAQAVTCANGVYRAGCAGPNGAAVVHKNPPAKTVNCVNGVYRAGCAGPNGAAVIRK
jgi:hypothetical protein